MGNYVPSDWTGPTARCHVCGNEAPDVKRDVGDVDSGARECTRCLIGRVVNELCTEGEARALRAELTGEIRHPSLPWNDLPVVAHIDTSGG